ncbi:MAG: tRNA (adenosine(37)-N6)-dimethylallyltransferase MiaA [Firmicutes bacterium]|nr:tRNA (adenosine(37)-N6)-dimethylallyltransferase MiaA [Bacillota bacterium]
MINKPKILVIAGPTAVGKTKYAIEMARRFDGEVVNCDSMQIYKYMDIGSAKPTAEELSLAVHHLVDFVDPREDFSVAEYQKLAKEAIRDIISRGKLPVISGGTGLYLNSLLYEMDFSNAPRDTAYRDRLWKIAEENGSSHLHKMLMEKDPEIAVTIHENNTKKIIRALERLNESGSIRAFTEVNKANEYYDPILVGLSRDRAELYDRINARVDILMEKGLIDEVKKLMDMGLTFDSISMKGIGYKEIISYLEGQVDISEATDNIKKNSRHYAKRQLTWFRRYDKMFWLNISDYESDNDALEALTKWLQIRL